jgi:hypothetical protein
LSVASKKTVVKPTPRHRPANTAKKAGKEAAAATTHSTSSWQSTCTATHPTAQQANEKADQQHPSNDE